MSKFGLAGAILLVGTGKKELSPEQIKGIKTHLSKEFSPPEIRDMSNLFVKGLPINKISNRRLSPAGSTASSYRFCKKYIWYGWIFYYLDLPKERDK